MPAWYTVRLGGGLAPGRAALAVAIPTVTSLATVGAAFAVAVRVAFPG